MSNKPKIKKIDKRRGWGIDGRGRYEYDFMGNKVYIDSPELKKEEV